MSDNEPNSAWRAFRPRTTALNRRPGKTVCSNIPFAAGPLVILRWTTVAWWRLNRSMKIFFDVPVYRITKAKYESEQCSFIQRGMLADGDRNVQEMYRRDPARKKFMENHFGEIYGGCWQFNETIGFIRLYFFFTQIRGEYWRVSAKRTTRTRKKVFAFFDHKVTFEEEVPARSTNRNIYSLIQKYLARAQNERHLKAFYIDKSVFEYVGPYIDWNALGRVNTN